jgi:hypothetical protein
LIALHLLSGFLRILFAESFITMVESSIDWYQPFLRK